MNRSKITLFVKIIISLSFVAIGIITLTSEATSEGSKPFVIGTIITGAIGLIISFIESITINKERDSALNELKNGKIELDQKDKEIANINNEIKERRLLAERTATLSKILQEAEDIKLASANILETIAKEIEICQGVLYVTDEKEGRKYLWGAAAYAYHKLESEIDQPQFGVGLVGQTAQEKQSLYLNDLPTGYIDVVSGLGKAQPGFLALIPLMYSGEVLGVIELASFSEFKEKDKELFEGIKDALGAGIHFLQQSKILHKYESEIETLKSQIAGTNSNEVVIEEENPNSEENTEEVIETNKGFELEEDNPENEAETTDISPEEDEENVENED